MTFHMHLGERAPSTADREKLSAATRLQPAQLCELLINQGMSFFDFVVGQVDKPQTTDRQRCRLVARILGNIDQFKATASQVAGEAIRLEKPHTNPRRSQRGLTRTRQYLNLDASGLLGAYDKVLSVFRIPNSCCRQRLNVLDA